MEDGKKTKKNKKRKREIDIDHMEIGDAVATESSEVQFSSIKLEEIPQDPEHHNKYLMRRYESVVICIYFYFRILLFYFRPN